MKALTLWFITLGLCVAISTAQFQGSSDFKPITFEDVLRQLLGVTPNKRPSDRILNSATAAKLREALQDDAITPEVTSSKEGSKPSRFDGILRLGDDGMEPETDEEKQAGLGKGDQESEKTKAVTNLKPEVTKGKEKDLEKDVFPEKKWKKPSRFDGSYDELLQEWKQKQAAILKMAAAAKKESRPEVSVAPSSRTIGEQQNRPNHRRLKRFFFSWPGSFVSPWPESERSNTFISNDPLVIQGQQIFTLFSNSFFNGLREMMQGMFRLRPPADPAETAAAADDGAASSSSVGENELKKRTITGRMISRRNRITRLQRNSTTKRPNARTTKQPKVRTTKQSKVRTTKQPKVKS